MAPKILNIFKDKLETNRNSNGDSYYTVQEVDITQPPALQNSVCHYPTKSNQLMVAFEGTQYQRPIHRLSLQLDRHSKGLEFLSKTEQASHLCMDNINLDGKGNKHCVNVAHMVVETDKANKERQRCPGWIWIHDYQGNPGGYWYPSCIHSPPCLRYQPKELLPTHFRVQ